jgi:formate dehydrogenase maturation protein FdhE
VTTGVRSGADWIGVIEYWNGDLFCSANRQKWKTWKFLKHMLAEMDAKMDANVKTTQDKLEAGRNADREDLKKMVEETMNANQAKTNASLKDIREDSYLIPG